MDEINHTNNSENKTHNKNKENDLYSKSVQSPDFS